jgi:hypothetical protein
MSRRTAKLSPRAHLLLCSAVAILYGAMARGQAEPAPSSAAQPQSAGGADSASTQDGSSAPSGTGGGPSGGGSPVGYIDNAIPVDMLRFRFDAGYEFDRPNRAEFFYARPGPLGGPGLPKPDTGVASYQDLTFYAEKTLGERLSGFVELPWRFLNPEINANTNGFSDMNAGFKYAFLFSERQVASFQFKTYIPTGDAERGLGNHHVSLEPGLLLHEQLSDRFCLDGELRYWIPVGGTDFAGSILRYGLGVSYWVYESCNLSVAPVAEFVGWTVFSGHASFLSEATKQVVIEDSAGDTIVNAKLGIRVKFGNAADLYTGYGRALTGDKWYSDIYRLEFRLYY